MGIFTILVKTFEVCTSHGFQAYVDEKILCIFESLKPFKLSMKNVRSRSNEWSYGSGDHMNSWAFLIKITVEVCTTVMSSKPM